MEDVSLALLIPNGMVLNVSDKIQELVSRDQSGMELFVYLHHQEHAPQVTLLPEVAVLVHKRFNVLQELNGMETDVSVHLTLFVQVDTLSMELNV